MKNKGFTLIELLATITLLALIMLVVMPALVKQSDKVKKDLSKSQVDLIYSATESYVKKYKNNYPVVLGQTYCVTLKELANEGLLPNDLTNYMNDIDVDMNLGVKITVDSKISYSYDFDYEKNACDASSDKEVITDFEYNGSSQTFTVPKTGKYKIELWGASGGNANDITASLGSYTKGIITLNKGEKYYIFVGEQGLATRYQTFNGGGIGGLGLGSIGNSGGGATDIRLINGSWNNEKSLRSRIMVVAGGGGIAYDDYGKTGGRGFGGALTGFSGSYHSSHGDQKQYGGGGTQISGGAAGINTYSATGENSDGKFGVGGDSNSTSSYYGAGGGGGGYYGGGPGGSVLSNGNGNGGGGGSSYISGHAGCIAIKSLNDGTPKVTTYSKIEDSYHYSGKKFTETVMKAGNEVMPNYKTSADMTGNNGNGHARITYIP